MPDLIRPLLFLYAGIVLVNAVLSLILWRKHRTELHRSVFVLWAAMMVTLLAQALLNGTDVLDIIGFSFAYLISLGLTVLLDQILNHRTRWRLYGAVMATCLGLGVALCHLDASFTLAALPVSLGVAFPQIHVLATHARRAFRTLTVSGKGLVITAVFGVAHTLDYPFLRHVEELAPLGFSIAIMILVALTLFAPAVVLEVVTQRQSRAKNDFLANMSHETRTPMTAILGMMDLLHRTALTAEQRGYVDTTREAASSLLRVIEDILDLSRVEAGHTTLRPEPASAEEIVRGAVRALAPAAERAGLALSVEADVALPAPVLIDPHRLRQVVTNLVHNAIKFTHEGAIRVTVSGKPSAQGHGGELPLAELEVRVADTGVGIPATRQSDIFEAFTQGEPSAAGGAGLGLSISREVTRLIGGEILLDSVPGEGSTFTVRLRVPLAATGWLPAPEPPAALPAGERPLRLLVAEDNRINRRLIARFLEDAGHDVTFVPDGLAAIASLANEQAANRFDAALVDVQMPGADGPEVVLRRRQVEQRTGADHLPMIAVTAHAMKGNREALLDGGFDGYLAKPFTRAELEATIARTLGACASSGSPPKVSLGVDGVCQATSPTAPTQ